MNVLTSLADRLCSHPAPALKPFDDVDWDAYSGCNSVNPEIAYTKRGSFILDGSTVEVVLFDEGSDYDGVIHSFDFPDADQARKVAEFLVLNPDLTPSILPIIGHS